MMMMTIAEKLNSLCMVHERHRQTTEQAVCGDIMRM